MSNKVRHHIIYETKIIHNSFPFGNIPVSTDKLRPSGFQ